MVHPLHQCADRPGISRRGDCSNHRGMYNSFNKHAPAQRQRNQAEKNPKTNNAPDPHHRRKPPPSRLAHLSRSRHNPTPLTPLPASQAPRTRSLQTRIPLQNAYPLAPSSKILLVPPQHRLHNLVHLRFQRLQLWNLRHGYSRKFAWSFRAFVEEFRLEYTD